MSTCWECPIGSDTCGQQPSRCPHPDHQHEWVDITELQDDMRRERCTKCGGDRVQPRLVWLAWLAHVGTEPMTDEDWADTES